MKTNVIRIILPAMAIFMAAGSAFAFKADTSAKAQTKFIGHIKDGQKCTPTTVWCQLEDNGVPCMSGSNVLFRLQGTSCPNQLFYTP